MENYAFYETYHNDWSIKNWGTKWNSYGYDNLDRSDISENPAFSFYTAWSAPHPII